MCTRPVHTGTGGGKYRCAKQVTHHVPLYVVPAAVLTSGGPAAAGGGDGGSCGSVA